jgi:hypothetical protein
MCATRARCARPGRFWFGGSLEEAVVVLLSVQLTTIKRMKPSPRSTAAMSNWMHQDYGIEMSLVIATDKVILDCPTLHSAP